MLKFQYLILLLSIFSNIHAQTADSKILFIKIQPGSVYSDDTTEVLDSGNVCQMTATNLGTHRLKLTISSRSQTVQTVQISYFNPEGIRIHHFEKSKINSPSDTYQVILKFPDRISPQDIVKLNVNGLTSFYRILEL